MRVVSEGTPGELYAFGRRRLWFVIRERFWWYAGIAIAAAFLTARYAIADEAVNSALELLVTLSAIASATRLVVPSYRMTVSQSIGVITIWLIFTILQLGIMAGMTRLTGISMNWGALYVILAPLWIWLAVKFSLATPFFTVEHMGYQKVGKALVDSWNFVESDRWWRLFGLQLAIVVTIAIPFLLVRGAGGLVHAASAGLSPASLAIALCEVALAIIANVWFQIAFVAMVSTSRPRARP